jgi:DNA polymerase-3 subunit delta'
LLCPNGGCGVCASCAAVAAGGHPDCTVLERTGASVLAEELAPIPLMAQRTPTAGDRQVIVLEDFHLAALTAPSLLKTIEEPPESTTFVIVADGRASSIATIASRCVVVEFTPLEEDDLVALLRAEGATEDLARTAASAAGGRLDRARLLVGDPEFAHRQARWRSVPERLDGTGATAAILATELLAGGDGLVEIVKARQADELAALVADAEQRGVRLTGRQAIETRFAREQRRARTDELRAGLATLVEAYRSRLLAGTVPPHRVGGVIAACGAIDAMAASLHRNPNESLQLVRMLLVIDEAARS